MPAIITHDFFGRDVYGSLFRLIGGSKDEADAFLLGNQGPDPLFYAAIDPLVARYHTLGHAMHAERPALLLAELKRSIGLLQPDERPVARAYALGFLCHYTLDSTVHPFVYSQQFALGDAGVEGLSRDDGSEIHALIESEFDELVLFAKLGDTIRRFNPATQILRASRRVLGIASAQHAHLAKAVYEQDTPPRLFARSVGAYRLAERAFRSTSGAKRAAVGAAEELVRRYSFFRAMCLRPVERTDSIFANSAREPWTCPFTGEVHTESFWDLYEAALVRARDNILAFDAPGFDEDAAHGLTGDLDFSGTPTQAMLVGVEDADAGETAAEERPCSK